MSRVSVQLYEQSALAKPALHVHVCEPAVLAHPALFASQLSALVAHSSMSPPVGSAPALLGHE